MSSARVRLGLVALDVGDADAPTAKAPTANAALAVPTAAVLAAPGTPVGAPLLRVFPAGSTFEVGEERFAVGLVDDQGPIDRGPAQLLFFKVTSGQGVLRQTIPAEFQPYGVEEAHDDDHDEGSAITGVFVARPNFDEAGDWGVVARVQNAAGREVQGQANFSVTADSPVPARGESPPAIRTLTAANPDDAAKICTANPVDDMPGLSVGDAIASGKPTVVLFASPLLCSTRTCGPSLETLIELKRRYGTGANFIQVEVYPDRDPDKPVAALAKWGLPSEPWLFLIDAKGKVVDRFEGASVCRNSTLPSTC